MKIGNLVVMGFLDNGKLPCCDNSTLDTGNVAWNRFSVMLNESVNAGTTFPECIPSTYSLVYTLAIAYCGGVLAPNGDIHFVPYSATVGQKINSAGVVSTYSLVYTLAAACGGGVLAPNGDIHFVPRQAIIGQKISTVPAKPFSLAICCSPFFNKL